MFPEYKIAKKLYEASSDVRSLTGQLHSKLGAVDMLEMCLGDCSYMPKTQTVQAFVPPEVFNKYGQKSIWFVDYRILWTIDAITEYFGKKIIVNNWHVGGKLKYRGFRPAGCGVGAIYGQHYFGRAVDCDIQDMSAKEIRRIILDTPSEPAFRYIKCLEDNVDWIHMDCRNTGQEQVLIVQP